MADIRYKDVGSRIATCLLLNKLTRNSEYGQLIGMQDQSHYTDPATRDGNKKTIPNSPIKQEIKVFLQTN